MGEQKETQDQHGQVEKMPGEQAETGPQTEAWEASYRALAEVCPDGIISFDASGNIIGCNEAAAIITGYQPGQALGKHARDIMVTPPADEFPLYWERLLHQKSLEGEFEILRADGAKIPVWARAVAIPDSRGKLSRAVSYIRDIADIKEADSLKDEFIGFVSHEMRTPLTVIIGAVSTVLTESEYMSQDETKQLLQDAVNEAEELSRMLTNLLELSRLQGERLELVLEPINVEPLVNRVVEEARERSSAHRLVTIFQQRGIKLNADQKRLEHILRNLLENAISYSPRSGEIRIQVERNKSQVVFIVTDESTGISDTDRGRLLKPGAFPGSLLPGTGNGAGIGLLVCRRLVEAHGGHFRVQSLPGGITFSISLPIR
ncbi:MAG: PAS domain S-box protein [Chloroflexi bacterium]|nr:PAS domain S-box protein [Chloroflexota bacterium]